MLYIYIPIERLPPIYFPSGYWQTFFQTLRVIYTHQQWHYSVCIHSMPASYTAKCHDIIIESSIPSGRYFNYIINEINRGDLFWTRWCTNLHYIYLPIICVTVLLWQPYLHQHLWLLWWILRARWRFRDTDLDRKQSHDHCWRRPRGIWMDFLQSQRKSHIISW